MGHNQLHAKAHAKDGPPRASIFLDGGDNISFPQIVHPILEGAYPGQHKPIGTLNVAPLVGNLGI
jgi:hypothetical protein